MTTIKLSVTNELRAAAVGVQRQVIALRARVAPRHRGGSLWGGNIESACAELAVSLHTGLPWTGEPIWETPPKVRVPDVGDDIEVRWVAPNSRYEPTLNYDPVRDDPTRRYALVSGFAPSFEIHGWIQGADAPLLGEEQVYPERTVIRVPASRLGDLPAKEE